MKINWYGDTTFQLVTASADKENISITIDVDNADKRFSKLEADIVLKSHNITSKDLTGKNKSGDQFLISALGEYEVKGIFVQGIPSLQIDKTKKNIIYMIEAENMRICHLGFVGVDELNEEQIEGMGNVDILLIPIDGDRTIGSKEAVKMISLIEPKLVIPMCFNAESLDAFLRAMAQKDIVPQDKLIIQKKNLSGKSDDDKVEIIVLEAK